MQITYTGPRAPLAPRDIVIDFLANSGVVELSPTSTAPSSELYTAYRAWETRTPMTHTAFGRVLADLGSPVIRVTGGRRHRGGIRLL